MDISELQVDSLKHLSPEEWEQASQLLLEHDDAFLSLCRQDINTFIEYIMVDESTGQPVKQSAIHEDWHTLADLHPQLVIWSHPEAGKTQQFAVGRALWLLGHNPRLRISILCDTQQQAKKIVKVIAEHIENNPRLREVFPKLRKGQKWSETQLYVERPSGIKEPSVQACGTHGDIHGARIDYLLIDDILNSDNTRTAYMREEMKRWVRNSAYTRMTEKGRIVFIANAWHPDDLAHEQARMKGWKTKKYPVLDSNGNSTWLEKFPHSRIEKIKDSMGTLDFTRQYMCEARDDSSARFKQEYIDRCLENGNGISLIEDVRHIMEGDPDWNWDENSYNSAARLGAVHEDPIRGYLAEKGYQVFTGVDLAIQKHSAADLTVFFTILQYPKVWSPKHNKYLGGERQILNIESGRWTAPEIIDRIENIYDRFPGWFIIENVAAQDYILQFMRHRNKDIPIKPFTTGRQKADPTFGVESLASEFELGSWIFPNDGGVVDDEVQAYIEECLYYDPRVHTGDRLMASWFAREGARMLRPKDAEENGDVGVRIIG